MTGGWAGRMSWRVPSLGAKSDHNKTPSSRNEKSRVRRWYIHTGTLDIFKTVEIAAALRFLIRFLVAILFDFFVIAALVKCVEWNEIVTELRLLNCGRLSVISIRSGDNRFRSLRSRRRRWSRRSRTRLSLPVGTDDMRKFATFGGTSTLLGKIRALPHVLLWAVEASCAIA